MTERKEDEQALGLAVARARTRAGASCSGRQQSLAAAIVVGLSALSLSDLLPNNSPFSVQPTAL